jgi:hypothetical protein
MTTQAELLTIASWHDKDTTVQAIVTAIKEAQGEAACAHQTTSIYLNTMSKALAGHEGFQVPLSGSDIAHSAIKLSAAISKLGSNYMTLACALSGLGESIDY